MKKLVFLTFLLFEFQSFSQTYEIRTNSWTDFEGTLGNSNIQLSLYVLDNGHVKGSYCYKQYESKIELVGQIIRDKILIAELLNGIPNGGFEGKFVDGGVEGIWTDKLNTKSLEFNLTAQSVCGGEMNHRYSDFYGTDDDVETFMKQVKSSILNNDKEWIANHVRYPLNTSFGNGSEVSIEHKEQLIKNFDEVFHQNFKGEIESFCVCNMFHNYQGVMLGNGHIWIYSSFNSSKENVDFEIIAINN